MKRITALALAAGLMALSFSTATMAADGKKVTILASMRSLENPFFIVMMNAIKAEAEKIGNVEIIEGDGQDSSAKQTADVEAAIARGADGVLMSPADVNALTPALQEAVDAGLATATVDSTVNNVNGMLGHVGADNVKGGEAQAELIKKLFPDGATVINLQGLPGAGQTLEIDHRRAVGEELLDQLGLRLAALDVVGTDVAKHPVDVVDGGIDRRRCQTRVHRFLQCGRQRVHVGRAHQHAVRAAGNRRLHVRRLLGGGVLAVPFDDLDIADLFGLGLDRVHHDDEERILEAAHRGQDRHLLAVCCHGRGAE